MGKFLFNPDNSMKSDPDQIEELEFLPTVG